MRQTNKSEVFPDKVWLFQDDLYIVNDDYSEEEQQLLVLEEADKERELFERLRTKHNSKAVRQIRFDRPCIPEEVRIAVWRRDDGQCARCGSREQLEYDHIIPISKGGSNAVRNIELLCQRCNREKSDRIQ